MPQIGIVLVRLGCHGPVLLVLSLVAGAAFPELSRAAKPLLPASAFLLVLGAMLAASLSPPERERPGLLTVAALLFVAGGAPAATMLVLWFTPLPADVELGVLIAAIAPPIGSAAAVAAMLALRPRLALFLSMMLTLAAPLTMPLLMTLFAVGSGGLTSAVAIHLLIIIAAAAFIAAPPISKRLKAAGIVPDASAACGIAVIGLILVGITTAGGVANLAADAANLTALFALAIGLNIGLTLLAVILFLPFGSATALTIGLASGSRNVTLAWAAGAGVLPSSAQSYLAVSVVPILLLPLVIKTALALAAEIRLAFSMRRL